MNKSMMAGPEITRKQVSTKKGIYRHFKGQLYEVLEVATHSETKEACVVYKALYGERGVWVRPLAMFEETVERDGKTLKRFTWVEDAETSNRQAPRSVF